MIYYEIHVPVYDNAGNNMASGIAEFRSFLMSYAGGFHELVPVHGAWVSGGMDYVETMIPFHVACTAEIWSGIIAEAFRIFIDQKAIFTAEIGRALILERE